MRIVPLELKRISFATPHGLNAETLILSIDTIAKKKAAVFEFFVKACYEPPGM